MTNDRMTEDHELDLWREQWNSVAPPSSGFKRHVQERIKIQNRRFWLGNLLSAAALLGALILAVYQINHPASRFEKSAATGVFVLLFVSVPCRLWLLRRTWRAEARSTRAFVELSQRRVLAQIRGVKAGIYLSIGWLVFCVALAVANWTAIRVDLMLHPVACFALMLIIGVMLPVIYFCGKWFLRHKVRELNEVTRLLEEVETMNYEAVGKLLDE